MRSSLKLVLVIGALARVTCPSEKSTVVECLLPNTRREIGEFHHWLRLLFAHEPTLLENSARWTMVRVA